HLSRCRPASELLVDERRRLVPPLTMDPCDTHDDRHVVDREHDQAHAVRRPRPPQPLLGALDGCCVDHAAAPSASRRAMCATSNCGLAQGSRSNSAGEMTRPKASSKATIRLTVASESSSPEP